MLPGLTDTSRRRVQHSTHCDNNNNDVDISMNINNVNKSKEVRKKSLLMMT